MIYRGQISPRRNSTIIYFGVHDFSNFEEGEINGEFPNRFLHYNLLMKQEISDLNETDQRQLDKLNALMKCQLEFRASYEYFSLVKQFLLKNITINEFSKELREKSMSLDMINAFMIKERILLKVEPNAKIFDNDLDEILMFINLAVSIDLEEEEIFKNVKVIFDRMSKLF
jgi:hypothetical protein